ncbi:MAG: hypothetical protein FWE35_01055 [Streptosporangiales bacterium]|nr:hypothetical protein [Streptosporangiales bacterium]
MSENTDLAGKPFRAAGTTGRGTRRTKKQRQDASRANQERTWAARFEVAETPLQGLRVAVDRATSVAVKKQRRAEAALSAAKKTGDQAAIRQQQLRFESVTAELTTEITALIGGLTAFAERHETIRV